MKVQGNKFQLIYIKNPFDPYKDLESKTVTWRPKLTILGFLRTSYGKDFTYFERPTLCLVNGSPKKYEEWETYEIQKGDVVSFATLAGIETVYIIYALIVIVVALATYALMGDPKLPGQLNDADSVYNFSGLKNRVRQNDPIEIHYGKNRIFPSYAAGIYTQYKDNDQFNYSLYCIGQGRFDIHKIQLEDTEIGDFEDTEWEILSPGDPVTLFPDNVITSVEISNIQLHGTDEPEYDSWVGPFVINPPLTLCKRIDFDITWPGGLYENTEGKLINKDADFELSYRKIDDQGGPDGDWVIEAITVTRKTNTPQRKTYRYTVTPGRYEVRARRTDVKGDNASLVSQTNWEACRAFLPSTKEYGNVTLLALVVRANNNVNNNSQNRVNVIATRKLRHWTSGLGWSDFVSSRSIAWAFADVFTNNHYGCKLDDEFIDLEALEALHTEYEADNLHFDFSFENALTVWEAARTIARVGRAVPMPSGSRIGMIRDVPQTLSKSVFGPENILKDSFRVDYRHFQPDETDSIIMIYTDPDTYLEEEVTCVFPGVTPLNSERITFAGCKNRNHAYREGMYILANRTKVKDVITFRTGLEGHIPQYGDRLSVYHDVAQVGLAAGFVMSMAEVYPEFFDDTGDLIKDNLGDPFIGPLAWNIELSEPIEWSGESVPHAMMIRKKDGSADGPFIVGDIAPGGMSATLTVVPDPDGYNLSHENEPPIFLFGTMEEVAFDCKVVEINPGDDDTVEILCSNYEPDIFLYDNTNAPPLVDPTRPPKTPDRPIVDTITVSASPLQDSYVIVGWSPALGANRYILQFSADNVNWETSVKTTYTSFVLAVNPGFIYLRVAGINTDRGPWKTWSGNGGFPKFPPSIPRNLVRVDPDANTRTFSWDATAYATVYRIGIVTFGGAGLIIEKDVAALEYTITKAQYLAAGGDSAHFLFQVAAVNALAYSGIEILVVTNVPDWFP